MNAHVHIYVHIFQLYTHSSSAVLGLLHSIYFLVQFKKKYSGTQNIYIWLTPVYINECTCTYICTHFPIVHTQLFCCAWFAAFDLFSCSVQKIFRNAEYIYIYIYIDGFGGLEVACWPLVPKFAGSNPAEAVGFLRAKKSSARLPSEGK